MAHEGIHTIETAHPREGAHPTPITYLKVAFTLVALTGLEVGVFYIDALEPAFLPIFVILSIAKFALVVLFYMHLKFDGRLFSTVFVGGLLLAVAVVITLMALFQVLSSKANPETGAEHAASIITAEPDLLRDYRGAGAKHISVPGLIGPLDVPTSSSI